MPDQQPEPRRRQRHLTPEEKYEIWVQVLTRELTQAQAAERWGIDVTTVMKLRKVARDGALAALAAARPGRPPKSVPAPELAAAQAEIARLGDAVKELSVENLLLRGKARWG